MIQTIDNPRFNTRSIVEIVDNRIIIDENKLDLFAYPDYDLPEWKPSIELPAFSSLSQFYIDIETSGLDPSVHAIELIGLYNENNLAIIINCLEKSIDKQLLLDKLNQNDKENKKYDNNSLVIINSGSERNGLKKLFEILLKKNPDLLIHFDGFRFDLPFIIKRCEKFGISHNFWVNPKQTTFRTAQKWGKPSIYNGVWLQTYPKHKCAIIDLYHQVLNWDFSNRKLTGYSLKQSVLQIGLRSEARLELSYEEMRKVVYQGDIETFAEYLVYDLQDTKLLGDKLIPAIYYQKLFLPDWKLQSISHSGTGSKINDIQKKCYRNYLPETEEKKTFEGGLTGANAGMYLNVSKIDVASLYPSIMLLYGICSHKDKDKVLLRILKYLLNFRLSLKAKKKEGLASSDEKQTEEAYKIIINSMYGALGTSGIEFNDYVAAALVTSYGRKILKTMVKLIQDNGGIVCSIDTDGVYFATDDSTYAKNKKIHEIVQAGMPKGINLDYELEAKCFFVPPNTVKKIGTSQVTGTDEEQDGIRNDGLKKNYIIIDLKGKIKCKGKYVKRDRCKLEKEFQPNLVQRIAENGKQSGIDYYHEIINQMKLGIYPIDNLKITRNIRKREIKMLALGSEGDQVSYYFAEPKTVYGKKGKPKKNKEEVRIIEGEPGWQYYQDLVTKMFDEVMQFVKD